MSFSRAQPRWPTTLSCLVHHVASDASITFTARAKAGAIVPSPRPSQEQAAIRLNHRTYVAWPYPKHIQRPPLKKPYSKAYQHTPTQAQGEPPSQHVLCETVNASLCIRIAFLRLSASQSEFDTTYKRQERKESGIHHGEWCTGSPVRGAARTCA